MKTILAALMTLGLGWGVSAALISEDFSTDPALRGWQSVGDTTLFSWDPPGQRMNATWDSGRSNSYFWLPLGTVLAKDDNFSASFDLVLQDVQSGHRPNKPYTFELAVGFVNRATATNSTFIRGRASGVKNLVEFDYFPDFLAFGATVAFTMVSSNSLFAYSHNFPMELSLGERFRVAMSYQAAYQTLTVLMTRNGQPFGPLEDLQIGPGFSDFRLDAFALSSYSDEGADGSILAHGFVDNIILSVPTPPVSRIAGSWSNGQWQVSFSSQASWRYWLERTLDFASWASVKGPETGTGEVMVLSDATAAGRGFYRIKAERP